MKDVTPADIFKKINSLDKDITETKRSFDVRMYNEFKEVNKKIAEYSAKTSRLEKLILLLALIQLFILIGVM